MRFRFAGPLTGVLGLFAVLPAAAQTCPADCGADLSVGVEEVVTCVNIALASAALNQCQACDTNGDGAVTVDEVIQGVSAALAGCPGVVLASGTCRRPGPEGLMPCAPGVEVSARRCDDRRICLNDPAGSTMLSQDAVGSDGEFSVRVRADAGVPLVIEAAVEPAAGTRYRILDFGAVGTGAAARGTQGHGAALDGLLIDPVSEAAVQLLDDSGLENFANPSVVDIIAAVRVANEGNTFAGLDTADAANVATQTAETDPVVEETIQASRMTLVDVAQEGGVVASSVFGGNQFPARLSIDGDRATSWFSDGDVGGSDETFRWTGAQDDVITSIAVLSNAQHANPEFRTFGFGSVRIQVLTADDTPVFDVTRGLPGATDPDIEVFPEVAGRVVLLTFHGHDDPACGGFSELQVVARRQVSF
jgi:hypothetical protein